MGEYLTEVMSAKGTVTLVGTSVGPFLQSVLILTVGNNWNLGELHAAICLSFFSILPLMFAIWFLQEPMFQQRLEQGPQVGQVKPWAEKHFLGMRVKWLVPVSF